jgi:hypothetical protein
MPLPDSLQHSALYLVRRSIEEGAQLSAQLLRSLHGPRDYEQRLSDWARFNGVSEVLTRVTEDVSTARLVCMNFMSASDTFNVQPPDGAHTHYALVSNVDRLAELRRWFMKFPNVDGDMRYQFTKLMGSERWWDDFLALAQDLHTENAITRATRLMSLDSTPTAYTILERARRYNRLVLPKWAELVERIEFDPAWVYSADLPRV